MSRLGRRRSLEREIASRMGLLSDRTGGRRIILDSSMIRQLHAEATEIVAEVRRWQPSEGLLDHLITADDQVDTDADKELTDNLAWAKHRISRHALAEHGPIGPARAFRFPYLTLAEITMALEDRKESRVARVWVRSRLASDVVDKTLQNLLSQTPQGTEVKADE